MAFRDDKTIADYKNLHDGETCVVCGLGESLQYFTPDYQERFITIGVNDIVDKERGFKPHYQVITEHPNQLNLSKKYDLESVNQKVRNILDTRCETVFSVYNLAFANIQPIELPVSDIRVLTVDKAFGRSKMPSYRKVTTTALSVAVWMGFDLIGIIGHDCGGERWICPNGNALNMKRDDREKMDEFCKKIRNFADSKDIKLYNLSGSSRVTTIPKISIEEFCRLDDEK